MADYFGGAKNLVNQMVDRVIQDLFGKNIRSQEAFYAHAESVAPKISSTGQQLLDGLLPVLTAYHEARSQIHKLQQSSRKNSRVVSFFHEQTAALGRLVPETFITIYDNSVWTIYYDTFRPPPFGPDVPPLTLKRISPNPRELSNSPKG